MGKEKAKQHIETGRGILVDLLETIMAKLAELKDNVAGYNIFDDLLNDVLKPALKHAIENLIPTIGKHLGDLADKLKPKEYLSIMDVMEAAQDLKDIFNQVKAKIESGEVKDNIMDFLEKSRLLLMLRLLPLPQLSRLSWKRLMLLSKMSLKRLRLILKPARVFWSTFLRPSWPRFLSSRTILPATTSLVISSMMSSNPLLSMPLRTSSLLLASTLETLPTS